MNLIGNYGWISSSASTKALEVEICFYNTKNCGAIACVFSLMAQKGERMLGKTITVIVDRPMGACHPVYRDMIYPINYGYIAGVLAPDGEEQDAYILGVDEPVGEFTGVVIAIIHRLNDVEDKLVVAPSGAEFSLEEILAQTAFQEKYFETTVEIL